MVPKFLNRQTRRLYNLFFHIFIFWECPGCSCWSGYDVLLLYIFCVSHMKVAPNVNSHSTHLARNYFRVSGEHQQTHITLIYFNSCRIVIGGRVRNWPMCIVLAFFYFVGGDPKVTLAQEAHQIRRAACCTKWGAADLSSDCEATKQVRARWK